MAVLYLLLCFCFSLVWADNVSYNWNLEWIEANPDGLKSRPVIAINGEWPPPAIRAKVGDTVSIAVTNNLGNETTSIHCHGLPQIGSNQMDGPPGIVSCPIAPGSSFTYQFQITQPGTYWYHSHSDGQYMDGLRGPIIIEDPNSPYKDQYDEEIVLRLSDWYHKQQPILEKCYLSTTCNPDGAEPVPHTALMNDMASNGIGSNISVEAGKTYFVRIINMAAFGQMYLNFEDHDVQIVETDGVYTHAMTVQSLYIATGQRYGVLLKAKNTTSKNYAISVSMDVDAFDDTPDYLNPNITGFLVYNQHKPVVETPVPFFNVTDDMKLVPYDNQPVLENVTHKIEMNLDFFTKWDQNRAGFNKKSFLPPKVPTLYSVLSAPASDIDNPEIYGNYTNAHVLQQGDVVEITINNTDTGPHPLHIHGHQPQIVERTAGLPDPGDKRRRKRSVKQQLPSIQTNPLSTDLGGPACSGAPIPLRRDTWIVAAGGKTVLRFVADNPGVWFFHCHMEWHLSAGLAAVFIEAPQQIQQYQNSIDPTMQQICKAQGIPLAGNAVGNTRDWLDFTGENERPSKTSGSLISG